MMVILSYLATAVIGGVIGIFIYRNNVDMLTPLAGKIDVKFDELKDDLKKEIEDLKQKK